MLSRSIRPLWANQRIIVPAIRRSGAEGAERSSFGDYVAVNDSTAPLNTSLDIFTHGNPDSGAGVRLKSRPMVEVGDIITAQVPAIEPDV